MSILKSILHHYNKTSASYDTLHPETEVAQITDWSQGIVNTLASTALGSLISTLSSDSLMAKLMKLVLDVSGVKYLIDTNGYICFGEFFGGLIIQWGIYWTGDWTAGVNHYYAPLPISYSSAGYNVVAVVGGNAPDSKITNFAFSPYDLSKIEITFSATLSSTKYPFYYISIGK